MKTRFAVVAALSFAWVCGGCSETGAPVSEQAAPENSESAASEQTRPQAEGKSPAEAPAPPTEEQLAREVQSLYAAGEFDEAETQFATAREAFPDSIEIKELHGLAAAYLRRGNKLKEAFAHLQTLTDAYMEGNYDRQGYADLFGWRLGELAQLADAIEGEPNAEDVFADYRSRAEEVSETKPILTDIVMTQLAIYLSEQGRQEEARQLVEPILTKAREQLDNSPEDVEAILGVADALEVFMSVESAARGGGDVDTARTELLDFLFEQAKTHPKLEYVRNRFFSDHLSAARSLAYTNPDAAAAILDRIDTFEESVILPLEDDDLTNKWRFEVTTGNLLANAHKTVEESRARFALIGTPAVFPDAADGWVHADAAIKSNQLHGKVVVLDFFAVWCGPCIATFPHLRAWNDEFATDGLQVIGVTNYHSFDWDAEAKRPKRVDNLEPTAERAAMEQFVIHHGLAHAIAFMSNDELQKHYVVKGIPHIVLIDRSGKVRMHRIGSGERNAADLEQAIKECLAEPIPSLADGS